MELTAIPDVRRLDSEALHKLTGSIVAHYTYLNYATAAAVDKIVTGKTSILFSGGSIVNSVFLFILNFTLFYRQARALCCSSRRFFKNKSGLFIHVSDNIHPDSDSSLLINTCEDFTAMPGLEKEALLKTEVDAPFAYSAKDEAKMYPDITAQTRRIRKTIPCNYLHSSSGVYCRYHANDFSLSIFPK